MKRNEEALGITVADATYDESYGLWLRPHTLDEYIAKEARSYVKYMKPVAGDVLLDLGANIGCVSKLFLDAGCAQVIAVEPEPDNIEMLKRNLEPYGERAVVVGSAAVSSATSAEYIELAVSQYGNRGAHSTLPKSTRSRRPKVSVSTVKIEDLVNKYSPNLVKCDVEGAEFTFSDEIATLPQSVRSLMIELHLTAGKHARNWGIDLDRRILENGYKLDHGRSLEKSWYAVRAYSRT